MIVHFGKKFAIKAQQILDTCFSKIFEKLIHTRLTKFWTPHKVLTTTQHGFQSELSTTHALLDVINSSFENIKDNLFTGLILLDLDKAFDTVSHNILLSKLDHYGIRGTAKDLLQSFLKRNNLYLQMDANLVLKIITMA